MKMIVVTQCCCGCTVRTGSLIIGILSVISALLDFIYAVMLISTHDEYVRMHTDTELYFMGKGELAVSAVINVIMFVSCGALIYGILKERLRLIAAWIIVYSAYLAILLGYVVQIAIIVMIHTERVALLWEVPALLVALAVTLYCVIVVNSHYLNLRDGIMLPPRPPLIITV